MSTNAKEFHANLVRLGMEAVRNAFVECGIGSGPGYELEPVLEKHMRERMAQGAQVYAVEVALSAEDRVFRPSEPPP